MEYEPIANPKGSVIVCPGGGYLWRSPREAWPVGQAFLDQGWQPFILSYSIDDPVLGTLPLRQAAWAVRTIRSLADSTLNSVRQPVVICGFSAGGHIAASLGVHWDDEQIFSQSEERSMHRPDALILGYPVITAGEYCHKPSIERLVGKEDTRFFSLEQFVGEKTPPTFIWHTASDPEVSVKNSLLFANSLSNFNLPWEMHIFPYGAHGLSLATEEVEDLMKGRMADRHVASWFPLCMDWLRIVFPDR